MKSSTLEMKSALQRDGNKHHLLRRDLEIQHLSVKAGLFNTENQRSLVNQHNQGYGRGFCFNCSQRSRFEEVARVEGLNPPHSVISNLANELGLTFTQISDWFRHKRRKSLDAEDIWTPLQILVLTSELKNKSNPSASKIKKLARRLQVTNKRVFDWFLQHRSSLITKRINHCSKKEKNVGDTSKEILDHDYKLANKGSHSKLPVITFQAEDLLDMEGLEKVLSRVFEHIAQSVCSSYLEMLKQIQEMRYELIRLHQSYRNYFFSLSQLNYQHRHHLHQFFKTQSML